VRAAFEVAGAALGLLGWFCAVMLNRECNRLQALLLKYPLEISKTHRKRF
jgi:hypothetical protein